MDRKKMAIIYAYKNLLLAVMNSINDDWSKVARELDLTHPQHHLLWILNFRPGSTMTQLAEYSLWTVANVKQVVDNLIKKGIAVKYTDPRDARARRVYLTDMGTEMLNRARELGVSYRVLEIFDQQEEKDVTRELENLFSLVEMLQGTEYVDFIRANTEKLLGKN